MMIFYSCYRTLEETPFPVNLAAEFVCVCPPSLIESSATFFFYNSSVLERILLFHIYRNNLSLILLFGRASKDSCVVDNQLYFDNPIEKLVLFYEVIIYHHAMKTWIYD